MATEDRAKNMGLGIAMGVGIGTALGVAMDNVGFGIGVGIAIGVAFGASRSRGDTSTREDEGDGVTDEESGRT